MSEEEGAIRVLDHGYVKLVESWGSEEGIVEAARMSTGKGFNGWGELRCRCGAVSTTARYTTSMTDVPFRPFMDDADTRCPDERGGRHITLEDSKAGDEKLLRYLWTNKHATPFEMAGMTFEVQAPILVFREWHRHRVPFGYSEMSSRYTPLPDVNYIPSLERLMQAAAAAGANRQAGTVAGAGVLDEDAAQGFRRSLVDAYAEDERLYQAALQVGVPKELARVHLPVGRYSRMRATGNLRGWLGGFLTLRLPTTAQWEIRQYAEAILSLTRAKFPRVCTLFQEGRRGV